MLEVFNGEVTVSDDIQAKRNKLMKDRLKIQFIVMEKMGVNLDNKGFGKWEKHNAEKFARIFAEMTKDLSEIDEKSLAEDIYREMERGEQPS